MHSGWPFFFMFHLVKRNTFMRASCAPDPWPGVGGLRSSRSAGEAKKATINHSAAMGRTQRSPGKGGCCPEEDVNDSIVMIMNEAPGSEVELIDVIIKCLLCAGCPPSFRGVGATA